MAHPGTIPLPKRLIEAIHLVTDIVVDVVGQDCKLYQYVSEATDDTYNEGTKLFADPVSTKMVTIWSKEHHKTKNLGAMVEDGLPIQCRLKFEDRVDIGSIITVPYLFYQGAHPTSQEYGYAFEIIDRKFFGQDMEASVIYILSPVRDFQNMPAEMIADIYGRV